MLRFFTDSDCDVTLQEAKEWGIDLISMPYEINGNLIYPYKDFEVFNVKEFYDMLRKGTLPTTSALNTTEYYDIFEPVFKQGDDILYVHFSRAMTASFDNMDEAIRQLKENYPDRKFYEIDTKGITICAYAIVYEAYLLWKNKTPVEQILAWADTEVDHFATYFFADDLKFFRKSGRVSGLAGIMGNIIGIKPLINMDANGKMDSYGKAKGTKNAINAMLSKVEELKDDIENHLIIIGQTDSMDIANKVKDILLDRYGPNLKIKFVAVNPTAGSHCGPDTIGVNFHAIHR